MTALRARPIDGRPPITERLSGVSGLLVGTDFDGTLAPIVADPHDPLPTPENKRALHRLAAHPATVVAVISGRSISDLRPRIGIEDLVYVGNHGLEIDRGGPPRVHPVARERRPLLAEACQTIEEEAGQAPILVEDKHLTATVHYRDVPGQARRRIIEAAETAVAASDGKLVLSPGKSSLELRPAVEWDKGSALRNLAGDAPEGWTVLYLGDDDTDEDAFEALEPSEVGIHVGTDPDTAAGYRLADQAEVAPFLNALAEEIHGEPLRSNNGARPPAHVRKPAAPDSPS